MLGLKLATLLLLALTAVSLNLQATHERHPKSVIFQVSNTYSLPVGTWNQWFDFPGLAGEFQVGH